MARVRMESRRRAWPRRVALGHETTVPSTMDLSACVYEDKFLQAIQNQELIALIQRGQSNAAIRLHEVQRAFGWRCDATKLDLDALRAGNIVFFLWHLDHCVRGPREVMSFVIQSGSFEGLKWVCTHWWQKQFKSQFPIFIIKKTLWLAPQAFRVQMVKLFYELQSDIWPLLDEAAAHGDSPVVEWLLGNQKEAFTTAAMDGAASNGHLSMVQWLHDRGESCTTRAMDNAAANGHLEVVQWLHEHRSEGCTVAAMDGAATNNHLTVVRWLHSNRKEGCTVAAIDSAAANGHLAIIKWLLETRDEGCSSAAMDDAAGNGHFAVVQWLHEHRVGKCTTKAMDKAASNGHHEMVLWLHNNRTEGCTNYAMDKAAANGHLTVLWWLRANRSEGFTTAAMDQAAGNGHQVVITWLNRYGGNCSEDAILNAARNGYWSIVRLLCLYHADVVIAALDKSTILDQLRVVKWFHAQPNQSIQVHLLNHAIGMDKSAFVRWLHASQPHILTPKAMTLAVTLNHLETVRCLHEIDPSFSSAAEINRAVALGHLNIIKFFHQNSVEGFSTNSMDVAATNGRLDVVQFLHTHRREGCTTAALFGAIEMRRVDVVEYIYANRLELITWPRREDAWRLLQLLRSSDEKDQEILRLLTSQRSIRYRPELTPTVTAIQADNHPQRLARPYYFRVLRCLQRHRERIFDREDHVQTKKGSFQVQQSIQNVQPDPDEVPEAWWATISEFLGGHFNERWTEWDAASRGWVHWLATFSDIHHRHLVCAVQNSNLDAVQRIHDRLAVRERLQCEHNVAELLIVRGSRDIFQWHLEQCGKVTMFDYVYLAVWTGRWDVLGMLAVTAGLSEIDTDTRQELHGQQDVATAVEDAVMRGDLDQVREFRSSGALAALTHSLGSNRHSMLTLDWTDPSLVTFKQMRDQFERNLERVQQQQFTPIELAARHGQFEVAQYFVDECRGESGCTTNAVDLAAMYGHTNVVQLLMERGAASPTISGFYGAIHYCFADLVQYLLENCPTCGAWPPAEDYESMACALFLEANDEIYQMFRARRGMQLSPSLIDYFLVNCDPSHLDSFHKRNVGLCTTLPMDLAAARGQLSKVRWCHENRLEGCSVLAMNGAAEGGHLDVVQFLHEHRTEGCTRDAMDLAAKNGKLSVVQFLHENRSEGCSPYALYWATFSGHLDVVRYLVENGLPGDIKVCLQLAETRRSNESFDLTNSANRIIADILRVRVKKAETKTCRQTRAQRMRQARMMEHVETEVKKSESWPDEGKCVVLARLEQQLRLRRDAARELDPHRRLLPSEDSDLDSSSEGTPISLTDSNEAVSDAGVLEQNDPAVNGSELSTTAIQETRPMVGNKGCPCVIS